MLDLSRLTAGVVKRAVVKPSCGNVGVQMVFRVPNRVGQGVRFLVGEESHYLIMACAGHLSGVVASTIRMIPNTCSNHFDLQSPFS
jgi:hypothetical protein